MCQTKKWDRLLIQQIDDNLRIVATRSDKVIITKEIIFPAFGTKKLANNIAAKALTELESYRNCNCDTETKCPYHIKLEEENK